MGTEFDEGVVEGRYIRLEGGWAIPSRWSGPLVAFKTRKVRRDQVLEHRFALLVKSKNGIWRNYFGVLEENGMYGQSWWEEYREQTVGGYQEGLDQMEAYLNSLPD